MEGVGWQQYWSVYLLLAITQANIFKGELVELVCAGLNRRFYKAMGLGENFWLVLSSNKDGDFGCSIVVNIHSWCFGMEGKQVSDFLCKVRLSGNCLNKGAANGWTLNIKPRSSYMAKILVPECAP